MAIAGKVSIVPKGEWQSTAVYTRLDLVTFNRNAYLSLKNSTGIEPTNTEYWMLLIENVSNTEIEALQTQIDDIVEDIADIIDGTTPVAKTNDSDLLQGFTAKQAGESGVRNLLPYPYYTKNYTVNGIDFADNGDGTVTINGTATGDAFFNFIHKDENKMPIQTGKTITMTNNASVNARIVLMFIDSDDNTISDHYDLGDGIKTKVPDETTKLYSYIYIKSGTTVDNETIRPMLELGSIAHDFAPYHFGGAEDSLKLNGLTAEEFVSNENLLPNGYFKNPVNSSGKTEWTGVGINIIDGWKINFGSTTTILTENGLKLTDTDTADGHIIMKMSNNISLLAGTYTISAKVAEMNGTWLIGGTMKDTRLSVGITTLTFTLEEDDSFGVYFWKRGTGNDSITIEWIKLEPGSIATPYIPPNKEVEKLKCGATGFVNGTSPYFSEGETILDWANNPNGVYKKFAVSSNGVPSDAPIIAEGFCELLIDNANARKIVRFSEYTTGASKIIYERVIWASKWANRWINISDGGNADTLNGYHADNLPYLPLSGGKIIGANNVPIVLKNGTNANSYIQYEDYTGLLGYLGFQSKDAPCYISSALNTYSLLHTGNSKPTHISATAPTDTSALWYDTTNKVCKYYKDGAWQQ